KRRGAKRASRVGPRPARGPEPGPMLSEPVEGPWLASMPDAPASRSADIFSGLERPVIVEQQHALRKSKRRSVLLRQGQRWQLPAADDCSIACDHPRLRWTPG